MKAEAAEQFGEGKPPGKGWHLQRWIFFIALAFAAHVALIFIFGSKKISAPRAIADAPQFHFASADDELIALTDPTLFVLPHRNDFAPLIWLRAADVSPPAFRWTEPPPFLPLPVQALGVAFNAFMQTNRFATSRLTFKPEPQITIPFVNIEPALPQKSTLQLSGAFAHRRMLNEPALPVLPYNDVIRASRVQALVDTDGNVVSVVLLESSYWKDADDKALELARTARFVSAPELMFGELIFKWHTVPTNAP